MKNKKLLYVLLPLVLIIWGYIVYMIYTGLDHGQPQQNQEQLTYKTHENHSNTDTFTLLANYRDPFLQGSVNSMSGMSLNGNDLLSNRSGMTMKNPAVVVFPEVSYVGLIVNSQKKQKTGLVKINSKDYLVKEGELQQTIKIYRLYNDSVIIQLIKVKKTIRKNK